MQRAPVGCQGAGVLRDGPCRWMPSLEAAAVIIIQFKYFHAVLYHNYFEGLLISVNCLGLVSSVEVIKFDFGLRVVQAISFGVPISLVSRGKRWAASFVRVEV